MVEEEVHRVAVEEQEVAEVVPIMPAMAASPTTPLRQDGCLLLSIRISGIHHEAEEEAEALNGHQLLPELYS